MCDKSDENLVEMSDNNSQSIKSGQTVTRLSYQDKYDIICKIERGVNRKQIINEYNLKNYSNINCILRRKEKIIAKVMQSTAYQSQKTFRSKTSYYSKVEEALILWIKQMRQKEVYLPASTVLEKAKEFAIQLNVNNFEPTAGYVASLRRRFPHLFPYKRKENVVFDESVAKDWVQELNESIEHYKPSDVFCLQEFVLHYRLLPLRQTDKKSDDKFVVVLICNADGSERLCSVIDSHRASKGVNGVPIDYYFQSNSMIDRNIFGRIIDKTNEEMKKKERKILIFLSNRAMHSTDNEFSNINLKYFPQNCELKLQPLDQRFIASLKTIYRKQLTELLISKLESGLEMTSKTISLLDCITILNNSLQTFPKQYLIDCFRKSNYEFNLDSDESHDYFDLNLDVSPIWTKLTSLAKVKYKCFDDYVNVDKSEAVESAEDLSDDQILRHVKRETVDSSHNEPEEEDDVNDRSDEESISTAEALNAISVLRRYFDQISDNSVDQQLIDIQLRVIDNI